MKEMREHERGAPNLVRASSSLLLSSGTDRNRNPRSPWDIDLLMWSAFRTLSQLSNVAQAPNTCLDPVPTEALLSSADFNPHALASCVLRLLNLEALNCPSRFRSQSRGLIFWRQRAIPFLFFIPIVICHDMFPSWAFNRLWQVKHPLFALLNQSKFPTTFLFTLTAAMCRVQKRMTWTTPMAISHLWPSRGSLNCSIQTQVGKCHSRLCLNQKRLELAGGIAHDKERNDPACYLPTHMEKKWAS